MKMNIYIRKCEARVLSRIRIFTFVIILLITHNAISFAQNNFYKSFKIESGNGGLGVVKTFDKGFASITQLGEIVKVDSNINLNFYKRINCDTNLTFHHVIQTTDSGFIIVADNNPFNLYGIGCVVKFDLNGNYLWSKKYFSLSMGNTTNIMDVIASKSNGFYLLTSGCSGGPALTKCSETGEIIWQKVSSHFSSASKIIKYSDDKFLIIGSFLVNNYLTKINVFLADTSGSFLWAKELNYYAFNSTVDAIKT